MMDQFEDDYWAGYGREPIGGGNPYMCCVGCGRSDPEINGDIRNHGIGCREVADYMKQSESKNYDELFDSMLELARVITPEELHERMVSERTIALVGKLKNTQK